jgi:hypothetical protein
MTIAETLESNIRSKMINAEIIALFIFDLDTLIALGLHILFDNLIFFVFIGIVNWDTHFVRF